MATTESRSRKRSQVAPFRLFENEPLERPPQPKRVTFEDFTTGTHHLVALARSVVPIELAQPGDEQVVLCGRWGEEHSPAMSLDPYLETASVVSVIADRPFVVSKPYPQVQELFITNSSWAVDSDLLRRFPGLVCLVLGGKEIGPRKIDLNVLHSMLALRDLMIEDPLLPSIGALQHVRSLERLLIKGFIRDRRIEAVAELANLRWLAFGGPYKGCHKLGALPNLERVEMMGVRLTSLKAFRGWSKLKSLKLGGSLRSFEGIQVYHLLEELGCFGAKLPDLEPLAALSGLRRLDLRTSEKWKDFTPLADLTGLRILEVTLGTVTTDGHIPSLDFLARMRDLEEFWGRNACVDDGRLDVLFGLPRLKRVFLVGDLARQEQELRRRRPKLDLEVITPSGVPDFVIHPADAIEIREFRDEGLWSICQDLTGVVGGGNNYEADRRIRRAIRGRIPSLLRRLDFDPAADFVLITARSEEDIRQAAKIIQSFLPKG